MSWNNPIKPKSNVPSFNDVMEEEPSVPSFSEVMGEKKSGGENGLKQSVPTTYQLPKDNGSSYADSLLGSHKDLDWVKRLYEKNAPSIQIKGEPDKSTHFMGDDGNGYVFPTVVRKPGESRLTYLGDKSEDYARETNTGIQLPKDEGTWFADNGYKLGTGVNNSINPKGIPFNNPNYKTNTPNPPQLQKQSVPTTLQSQDGKPIPNFGLASYSDLAKGQQNVHENTASTQIGQFEGSVEEKQHHDERAATREQQRQILIKNTPIAIENAAKKSLKIKGIDPNNAAQLNQEKANMALQVAAGDAKVGINKDGEIGLYNSPGFLESFHTHMMSAIEANKNAREFAKMNVPERVEFAKKLQQQTPSPYLGEKPTPLGTVGAMSGGFAPTAGLYGAGALAGSALEALAPETGGLSNLALKPVMTFVMNAGAGANQKGMEGTLSRFNAIKKMHPDMNDEDAMTQAGKGEDIDRLAGIGETALFAKTGNELKLGKSATGNLLKGMAKSAVDVGSKVAAVEGLKDIGHNIEGVTNKKPSEIYSDVINAFNENAPVGGVLHAFMGVVSGLTKVPAMINSALKYDVLTKMKPEEVQAALEENVKSGAITPEDANNAVAKLKEFDNSLRKVPDGLDDASKASAAGLILKRDNITKDAETKDKTAQDLIKQRTGAIDNQLKELYRTGKPLQVEENPATGETFEKPTFDNIAALKVKNLADKISKGKEISEAEDLQTQANFPQELEKQLQKLLKEEKSLNKDKEKPNTEVSDNVNDYLNEQAKENEKSKVSIPTEKASITDEGTNKIEQPTEVTEEEKKLLEPHEKSLMLSGGMNDNEKLKFIAQQAQNISQDGIKLEGDARQSTENAFGKDLVDAAIKKYPQQELLNQNKSINYALPQSGASSVFQHTQESTGETGGERQRMESSEQGNETTGESGQPPTIQKESETTGEGEKLTGVKKSITEPLRTELGLPKIELPKMGSDIEGINSAKVRIDNGEVNPRDLVNRILDDKEGYRNENEVNDLQYYAHQLNAKVSELRKAHSEAETPEEKANISGQIQQLSDETDRYTEAALIAGNKWGKIGNKMQIMIDEAFNPSRERAYIKDAFGGEIPKDFQVKLDKAFEERDKAIAERNKIESELTKLKAQKEANKNKSTSKSNKTHEDFVKDRQNYIKELKDAKEKHEQWLKDNGIQKSGISIPLTGDMLKAIGKIVKSHVEEGVQKAEEIASKVYDEVKDIFEGITKNDIIDIMAGRYNIKSERTDLAKQVAEVRKEAKKISDANLTHDEKTQKEIDRLNKKADTIEQNIKDGKLESKKEEFNPTKNNNWVRANQRVSNAEFKVRKMKSEAFNSKKNMFQKGFLWGSKLVRASVLSGINVLYKLASAASIGGAVKRIPEQAFGIIWGNIFRGIAKKAPIEGFVNAKSEIKFYKDFFNPNKFIQNNIEIAKTHSSFLNKKMGESYYDDLAEITMPGKQKTIGGKISKIGMNVVDRTLTLPLDVHQMIKDPIKRATYEASLHNGLVWAEKNGLDIHDPLIIHSMEVAAYKRANYEIFQEKRWLSKKFNEWKNNLEKSGTSGAAAKLLVDFMLPVSTVPTNIAARLLSTSPIGLVRGSMKVIDAYRNGIEKLQPEEADAVMRQLKQGSLGTALWLVGWFGAGSFGGLYSKFNPNKKRDEGELTSDEMEVGGKMLPKPVQHALPLEIIQLAATMRHIYDNYKEKKGASTFESLYNAGLGSIGGIMEQIPIIETGAHLMGAATNPYEASKLKEDLQRRVEPTILRETGIIPKNVPKGKSNNSGF